MNVHFDMQGDVTVLTLSGRLMGGGETNEFKDHIQKILDEGKTKIVVDLGRVKWMNSSAIGILIAGLQKVRVVGGDIYLARAGKRIISVFVTMQLEKVFKSFESVEEAVSEFGD